MWRDRGSAPCWPSDAERRLLGPLSAVTDDGATARDRRSLVFHKNLLFLVVLHDQTRHHRSRDLRPNTSPRRAESSTKHVTYVQVVSKWA